MIHEISEAQGEKMPEIDCTEKEQYKRRWNQRLYGLADIKAQVVDICCADLPELTIKTQEDVDVVHKLERKLEGNATRGLNCHHPVSVQILKRYAIESNKIQLLFEIKRTGIWRGVNNYGQSYA